MSQEQTLLLVEDDPVDQMAFERFVRSESLPYAFLIAGSVGEAERLLADRQFDVIITDYNLGDGTGFDVLRLEPATPKIFVTGSGDEQLALRALKDGALDYLVKDRAHAYLKCLPAAISSALRQRDMAASLESFKHSVGSLVVERDTLLQALDEARKSEHELRVHERLTHARVVKALERMLSDVSHELRTPLAGIRAMVEFLLKEHERNTEAPHEFLKLFQQETVRMSRVVNDLLELARLNSGAANWQWAEFSLQQIIDEATVTIRPLIDEEKVALSLTVTPPELMMQGDSEAVRRLVLNLLSNASKHTREGEIAVRCDHVEEKGVVWVRLEVSDSGSGISDATLEKLGEAFRANTGTIGDGYLQGCGLGLAIARSITAAHGGYLEVETEQGEGTTMRVYLRSDLSEPMRITGFDQKIRVVS